MKQPVILQVITELSEGGVEITTIEMSKGLKRSGAIGMVVAERGRLVPLLEETGSKYIAGDMNTNNPIKRIKNIFVIKALIEKYDISLIHAGSRAPAWSAYFAAKWTKIPYLATYHGAFSEKFYLKKFYNSIMVRGKITIVPSHFIKELIHERYVLRDNQVRVVYGGVDFKDYDPSKIQERAKVNLRAAWGVTAEQKIIFLAARMTRLKGHHVVIEAAKILKEKGELANVVFVFAGGHKGRESFVAELRNKISDYGLEAHFKVVGNVDTHKMTTAYAISMVSMSTSIVPETFGRTGVEAQAMECPIIATTLGAPKETCVTEPESQKEEITGWLTQAGDPHSLVEALEVVLEMSPEARKAIGSRARDYVFKKFTIENMQHQTLEVYDELLGSDLVGAFQKSQK